MYQTLLEPDLRSTLVPALAMENPKSGKGHYLFLKPELDKKTKITCEMKSIYILKLQYLWCGRRASSFLTFNFFNLVSIASFQKVLKME